MRKAKTEKELAKSNALRRKKYLAVLNAWGDVKLAQQARQWSEERIKNQLGIKLPKSMPTKRKMSAQSKVRKQKEYERYQYLQSINRTQYNNVIPAENLYRQVKYGYGTKRLLSKLEAEYDYYNKKQYPPKIGDKAGKIEREERKKFRSRQWGIWISNKTLPYELEQLAEHINLSRGLDRTNPQGYIIVYNAYINQENVSIWINKVKFIGFDDKTYTIVG